MELKQAQLCQLLDLLSSLQVLAMLLDLQRRKERWMPVWFLEVELWPRLSPKWVESNYAIRRAGTKPFVTISCWTLSHPFPRMLGVGFSKQVGTTCHRTQSLAISTEIILNFTANPVKAHGASQNITGTEGYCKKKPPRGEFSWRDFLTTCWNNTRSLALLQ